jgi:hypothetical protein
LIKELSRTVLNSANHAKPTRTATASSPSVSVTRPSVTSTGDFAGARQLPYHHGGCADLDKRVQAEPGQRDGPGVHRGDREHHDSGHIPTEGGVLQGKAPPDQAGLSGIVDIGHHCSLCHATAVEPPDTDSHQWRSPMNGWTSWPVSRILFPDALRRSVRRPSISTRRRRRVLCGLPAGIGRAALERLLSGLAPGGVYRATPVTRGAGGLLHRRFTLTPCADAPERSVFCGTVPRVTPGCR